MGVQSYVIIIVGGGTAGSFAAATAAREGYSVVVLERKTAKEAGNIACGDAVKGKSTFPDVIDLERLAKESFTNRDIRRAIFENPMTGQTIDIPFGETKGTILDRYAYGQVLLDEVKLSGAEVHYDTVIQDVIQNGQVTGVTGIHKGKPVSYQAPITIDTGGSMSLLQDKADFSGTTFDTNVSYKQFCSAYREVIELSKPVDWHDAIIFKPTAELGYLWYFPRTPTLINVGVGFQMNKPPMELVKAVQDDIRSHPDFKNCTVVDKLGAALPTRRPFDSAVAPGFLAAGDSAGHVNPTTGGGIGAAANSGHFAAQTAMNAIDSNDVSESSLWNYNAKVMESFGKRYAAMDLYNIWGGAHDVSELTDVISCIPAQQLVDIMSKHGSTTMGLWVKFKTLTKAFRHWGLLFELYRINKEAGRLKHHYDRYPSSPDGFDSWKCERDLIMDSVYSICNAEPKY
jgi:electron-transferring-flavoprotein dehydrogenase